jgi:chromosome segregation ATPase
MRRSAVGSVKAAMAKLGEVTQRPDTAPSGPAEMDFETKRRSAQIMQEFFQETNMREKLQEQCDDLTREVDVLTTEKAKLRKQLTDAQETIAAKGGATNGVSSADFDQAAHTTLVDEMETKFARETKQLEEQSQQLEVEKQAAQDREAEEARKAAELQQVLDDLNDELERQGREWDAEKKKLAEQTTHIAHLNKELASLRQERATLSHTLETFQTQLSTQLHARDGEIVDLNKTVEELRSEMHSAEQRHQDTIQSTQRSLETDLAEAAAMADELQSKVQTLEQQHIDDLRLKDETIASHVEARTELQNDLTALQHRADQTTADLESERSAHAENLQEKLAELQTKSQDELRIREDEVSGHLKSIEGLQEQITKFQQGETDGARIAQDLQKQIQELTHSHEAALKAKADENDELVQQLEAINDQLSADATELEQLKDEVTGLRKTISTLEQVSQQEASQHASELAKIRAELNEARAKADTFKGDVDASRDAHQEQLRTLTEAHDAKIESLRAGLEEDASDRVKQSQAENDVLLAEKNAALEQHEKDLAARTEELEALKVDLAALTESSGSAAKNLEDALAKHQHVEAEKAALEQDHSISQKVAAELQSRVDELSSSAQELQARVGSLVEEKNAAEDALNKSQSTISDLQARHDALLEDQAAAGDLQARLDSLTEEKTAAEEAHSSSQSVITDLQARHDALLEDKAAAEDLQARLDTLTEEKARADEAHAASQSIISDLQARHDALLEDKITAEDAHARAIDALEQDTDSASKKLLEELQSKYDSLLEEKCAAEDAHTQSQSIITNLQARHDSLLQEKTEAEDAHSRAINALKQESDSTASQQLGELQSKYDMLADEKNSVEGAHQTELDDLRAQRDALSKQFVDLEKTHGAAIAEIEQKYASLLETLQDDVARKEEEKAAAVSDKQATLDDNLALEKHLRAEIDSLKTELGSKGESDTDRESAFTHLRQELNEEHEHKLSELRAEIEELQARLQSAGESGTANDDHKAALTHLKEELKEQHGHAMAEAQAKHDKLQQEMAKSGQEHGDAIELMKEEFRAAHSNEVKALQQQLEALQKQHTDLTKEKASMDQMHEDVVSNLMAGMANSQSDAVQQLQKKYDALVAQLEAIRGSHAAELESIEQDGTEHQTLYNDLRSHHDKATADINAHAEEVQRLKNKIQELETGYAANIHAPDVSFLEQEVEQLTVERDAALDAAQDAEDRIEVMKGEVVKKHLARVEPLEKANASLSDKVGRLEAIIAAGDRVARAAATMGEQRDIDTLAEEDEEEEDDDDEVPGAQIDFEAPRINGLPASTSDVVITVSSLFEYA